MKRLKMTFAVAGALLAAVAGSAYKHADTSYYFFPTDASGNPQPVSTLLFESASSDPYGCADQTITVCSKGYTSHATNAQGLYIPAGTLGATITKSN